jgi:DNA polymerase-1
MTSSGEPVGGVLGTLRTLNKQIRLIKPDLIIVCWDGPGGSKKRRLIEKTYKEGRKSIRLNRTFESDMDSDAEQENRNWQHKRIIEYLDLFPILQFAIAETEADDIIAHLATSPRYQNWMKIISSNDKDFFQLCDSRTLVYRPAKGETINQFSILERYSIDVSNFLLARAVVGDKSDNLPGIKGAGLPTLAKRFPILREQKDLTISGLIDYCNQKIEEKSKIKVYSDISENEELIKKNYDLMQLYSPLISFNDVQRIESAIDNFEPTFNRSEVLKMMIKDNIAGNDWSALQEWSNGMTFKRREKNSHV